MFDKPKVDWSGIKMPKESSGPSFRAVRPGDILSTQVETMESVGARALRENVRRGALDLTGAPPAFEALVQGILPVIPKERKIRGLKQAHPIASGVGSLIQTIGLASGFGALTRGIAPMVSKSIPMFAELYPKLARAMGGIAHSFATGLGVGGTRETIKQLTDYEEGVKLGRVGKEALWTGAAFAPWGIVPTTEIGGALGEKAWVAGLKRGATAGGLVGTSSAAMTLIRKGKITQEDIGGILVNTITAAVLNGYNAKQIAQANRGTRQYDFMLRRAVIQVKNVHPEFSKAEAEGVAKLVISGGIHKSNYEYVRQIEDTMGPIYKRLQAESKATGIPIPKEGTLPTKFVGKEMPGVVPKLRGRPIPIGKPPIPPPEALKPTFKAPVAPEPAKAPKEPVAREITPKPPIVEPSIEKIKPLIEKEGAEWVGIQKAPGMEDMAVFTDPETKSTLQMSLSEITPENIKGHMEESRAKFKIEPLIEEARGKTLEEFVEAQKLQKAREEDVFVRPEFFDKGKSGISNLEGFSEERPVLASMKLRKSIVFRDKSGIPQGALAFDVTEKGKIDIEGTSEIFVNPEFRRQGIAAKLRKKAKELGFDISKVKDRAFTELGRKFEESQLTDIWKKAQVKQTLIEEARKYKTAEEFTRALEYHGTTKENLEKIKTEGFKVGPGQKGISTTQDEMEALEYGEESIPVLIKKDAEMAGEPGKDFITGTGSFNPKDIVLLPKGTTKSQLTTLWEKAQAPKLKMPKKLPLLEPTKGAKLKKPKLEALPRGETFVPVGLPKKVGLSAAERIKAEQRQMQEKRLGFVLKGEPKEIKITPAEKLKYEGKIPATQGQKFEAHRIARQKAFITPEGKTTPQYRRLARLVTGKKSMSLMTKNEATDFINNLKRISEPVYKKGKLIPPSIPRIKALVTPEFFLRKFKRPTPAKFLTSQTRYAELLGVKKLVEPMEIGKQEVDIEYASGAHQIDITERKLKQIKGISPKEMAKTLNIHEEAPPSLSEKEKEVFNYFRSLTRDILVRENVVRKTLGLPPIRERKAYFRHTADRMSQEIIDGKYPLPEGLKYWSEQTVGKKVYNPMEMQRKLRDDLLEKFSSDLSYVMKSMLWTGLKEIHLSIPKHILNKELGALTKDHKVYKNLSPQEQKLYDAQMVMPASTKKWLLDYVNIVLGGRQTALDESVNLWITDTPIKTVVNNILRPFGKHIGQKPITSMLSSFSKLPIYGAMGGVNPRQLIRNKFQTLQNMALYGVKNTIKGYTPISSYPVLKELKTDSLFKKSYSGFEDLPTGTMKKIEKIGLAPYQWSAISNVSQTMNSAFHWTADNIQNPKKAHLGWADPQRTYKESKDFFYSSEKAKLLKEMEYGAHTTQYQYIGMGMPEIFRYRAIILVTRLQSWWMNHWFVFHREAATRAFTGHTGYDPNLKIRLGDRINYLKYLVIGGLILTNLGYYRSYLFGTAPTSLPPTRQLMLGLYTYSTNMGDTSWEKRKRTQAEYQIKEALKIHLPGYLSIKDATALFTGKKDWTEYLFYKKKDTTIQPRFTGKAMKKRFTGKALKKRFP